MNPAPHALALLLVALGRAGIELAPHPTDSGRLRHRPAVLSPDLSARLRIYRAAVLRLVLGGYSPADDTDAGYVYGERLGVADGLGLATHPGSAAWLVAVGESMCDDAAPAASPPTPGIAVRLAGVLSVALGVSVRASTLPPNERFPGEPERGKLPTARNSCEIATHRVHSGHGEVDKGDHRGGEGE